MATHEQISSIFARPVKAISPAGRLVSKDMKNPKRFYVYRIFDGFETVYVGKGSGRRLASQKSHFGLDGEIIAEFARESEAYAYEIRMISELMPTANKHPGGNGSWTRRRSKRRFKWEIEIDRVGSRRYAARELLKFDLSPYVDPSKIEMIRQVANGPRV